MTGSRKPLQKRKWTTAEVEQLELMAEDYPFALLCRRWNRWARKRGLLPRSQRSIGQKLMRLGLSRIAQGQWITVRALSELLGKNNSTLRLWSRRGLVRRHIAHTCSCIHRGDLVRLARDRPQYFAGCDRSALVQVLEDEALADAIVTAYPKRMPGPGRGKRCRWVDTGRVFPTIAAAARAAHVDIGGMRAALKAGRPVAGLRFEVVD